MKYKLLTLAQAQRMNYSRDRRKRRREHRRTAKSLKAQGGSTFRAVAHWHEWQARNLR